VNTRTRILPRLPGWLWLVAAMTAIGPVSIDMYLPGFPLIEQEFGTGGVERTMAVYLFGIAISPLIYGPLSDRFGRKPPLYFSFTLYTAGSVGCMLAGSMEQLLLMRIVQALGAGAGFAIGRAIVRDRCEPHETARVFSLLMLIFSLGPILAPGVGGLIIGWWGWRSAFVFQVVMGLSVLLLMHRALDESRNPAHVVQLSIRGVAGSYWRLLGDRSFVGYALIGGFGMGTTFSYVTGASNVISSSYGLSPQSLGLLLGLNGFAFMLASRLNTLALDRAGALRRPAGRRDGVRAAAALGLRRTAAGAVRCGRAGQSEFRCPRARASRPRGRHGLRPARLHPVDDGYPRRSQCRDFHEWHGRPARRADGDPGLAQLAELPVGPESSQSRRRRMTVQRGSVHRVQAGPAK
jgi:Bcr/CflA subfamily drug resistance transporter